MAIRVVQLGSPRHRGEGPRVGTVRRPPRGVRKADHARLDYYDTWLPELAPSPPLVAMARATTDAAGWMKFERGYRRELEHPDGARLLDLLATLSHTADFSIGCYCEDESRCHRSILRKVLAERGALIV